MPGPVPGYRPTFTQAQGQECARRVRQQHAPRVRVARAKRALLLHKQPDRDSVTDARHLGQPPKWAYPWRKRWATGGFALTDRPGRGRTPVFPPRQVATAKALACALPTRRDAPLARYSTADLARLSTAHPAAPPPSVSTIWRILDRDALKPWRRWRFPRAPRFAAKAGRLLDRYAGWWDGWPLATDECRSSADEQTRSRARRRIAPTSPPRPGRAMRVEHEYGRGGARASLAAWDVRRGGVLGRGAATTGLASFGLLVDQAMRQHPYRPAPRVFWAVDNGSSHRGRAAVARRQARDPHPILVHLPIHASWRNQIARDFSIVQRKVPSPDLAAVATRLRDFEARHNDTAVPFNWRFTRQHFDDCRAALPDRPTPRATILPPSPPADAPTLRAAYPHTLLRNAALRGIPASEHCGLFRQARIPLLGQAHHHL